MISISRQCELLEISRAAYYYQPREGGSDPDLALLEAILDELKEHPFYEYRKVTKALGATRKLVRRIMRKAGLRAIYAGKRTSVPIKWHQKHPYLLRDKAIWLPNQVWATEITYIKLGNGYAYLVAIIDLYSREVLSWRVSNTLDAEFCVAALEEAIARYGVPAIFNTDQGCQFTSGDFTGTLERHGIRISMDGVNRALGNIFVERFWRSLKYEDIYLRDYRTMGELKTGVSRYFAFNNGERFHLSLGYEMSDAIYESMFIGQQLAAVA